MNSDNYFPPPPNLQKQLQHPQQQQQQQQHMLYQQASSVPSQQPANRCLATGHRTNPHSYYAAANGGVRGGNAANGGSGGAGEASGALSTGRPGTGAGGTVAVVDEAEGCSRQDRRGYFEAFQTALPPDRGDGDFTHSRESLHRTAAAQQQPPFGFSQYIGAPQQQQQQHRQQSVEQHVHEQQLLEQQRQQDRQRHWLQSGRNQELFNTDGRWMANVSESGVLPASQFPDSPPDSGSEPYSPSNNNRPRPVSEHAILPEIASNSVPRLNDNVPGPGTQRSLPIRQPLGAASSTGGGSAPYPYPRDPSAERHAMSHPYLQRQQGPPVHPLPSQHVVTLHPSCVAFNMATASMYDNPYDPAGPGPGGQGGHCTGPSMTPSSFLAHQQHASPPYGSIMNFTNHPPKKRKYSDSPPGTLTPSGLATTLRINDILPIKPEPCPPDLHYGIRTTDCGSDDDSYSYDFPDETGMFLDGSYQVIKWTSHQQPKWVTLLDESRTEIPIASYRIDADKGFNFAPSDDSFVCQKKNHFQITVQIAVAGHPKFIKLPESETTLPIDAFYLHFYGVKMESQGQTIKIEQSQSDRSKKQFHPVRIDLSPDHLNKMTVGRLHFSETTTNNMRKKGKPNPDQRYFQLVVALQAHCGQDSHMVIAHASERIVVRASNPGQFENDVEVTWNKGKTPESIYHAGRVGVNTDSPDEALTVHGNLKITGHIISPSDARAKKDIKELDTREQLENISKLNVYKYSFTEEFAEYAGLSDDERAETGCLAQEVSHILPDAVMDTGHVLLPNGHRIDNFLVVNKDRIFIENVGAVKELCKVTDKLENRIAEIEYINTKLSKLNKRWKQGSFISTGSISASISSSISRADSSLSAPNRTTAETQAHISHRRHNDRQDGGSPAASSAAALGRPRMCTTRGIQLSIIILVAVMFICLLSVTTLYLVDRKNSAETSALIATPSPFGSNTPRIKIPALLPPHCLVVPQDCPAVCSCLPPPPAPLPTPPNEPEKNNISFAPHENPTAEPNRTTGDNKTKWDNGTKRWNKTASIKDEQKSENGVFVIGKRSKRDSADMRNLLAQVYFKQLNETVSRVYCSNRDCSDEFGGNYSYTIPISPMFPRLFLTLKFLITVIPNDPSLVVMLCTEKKQVTCLASDSTEYSTRQINSLEWDLPGGFFVQSYYKFRIAPMSAGLCERPDAEVGQTFAEYNFSFYRLCSSY